MAQEDVFKKLVAHCKEYGFVFPSSDIYDGLGAVYDYGQNGVELKNNIKRYWWESMVRLHENIVGIDSAIFMHPTIWKASGHVDAFNDPLIDNKDSKKRYRADVLIEDQIAKYDEKIEKDVEKARKRFGEKFDEALFRETNPQIQEHIRKREALHERMSNALNANDLNEVRQIILDEKIVCPISGTCNWTEVRQFNLMFATEMGFKKWKTTRMRWHQLLGFGEENYRFHDHEKLAHYANAATDIEFKFPFGFKEVEGIHSRTDFDLSQHQQYSGKKIQYFDTELNESYVPYVIETSIGVDRMFLQIMSAAYCEEDLSKDGKQDSRVVLRLPAALAPVKMAIMPLVKKDGLPEKAQEIMNLLKYDFNCQYDEKDSIGKRYRRQDAIGTPFCITIDHQTLEDNAVTIRYRDTMEQERVAIDQLHDILRKKTDLREILKEVKI